MEKYRQLCRELPDQFESVLKFLLKLKFLLTLLFTKNYLPYNEGATYLGSDDQWVTFPGKDVPGGAMEETMKRYIDIALQLSRPAPLFNVSDISHLTDPVEVLIKQIEREQALLDEAKAAQSE